MWKELADSYKRTNAFRIVLVDAALLCFIIAALAFTRFVFVVADEAQQFRTDFNTQAVAIRTALQMGTSSLSTNLNDLNVTGKVITYRLDSQSTAVRAIIANAAKQSQVSSQQEMKTTRDAIKDSLADTKEVLQSVADQTTDAVTKPVQVNVQSPRAEEKTPIVTVQSPPVAPVAIKQKRGAWGKICHFLLHLKD